MQKSVTRKNHYVPEWYQKRFLLSRGGKLCYLNLYPDKKILPNGKEIVLNSYHWWAPSQCFFEKDLYTTFFFGLINDEIEKYLFGEIDTSGFAAIRAFISNDFFSMHKTFQEFFGYLDAQKIRTPKGLNWLQTKYPGINKIQLLLEMQHIRQMHCTMWVEATREIVSAEDSDVKFIITDHPVTIYNAACSPNSTHCKYPEDPLISFKGSQTIFPLDLNHCLILTNLEYAKDSDSQDLLSNRTNARHFDSTISRIDAMIRSRKIDANDVNKINLILKCRARRYIAAAQKEWLFPEKEIRCEWSELGQVLMPPNNELHHFGGEIYVGYEDGRTHYQDAYGRTVGDLSYLKKPERKKKVGANDECICGSGKKYKKCCRDKNPGEIPVTNVRSIRERNLMFFNMLMNILGLSQGKTWEDIRAEISDKQVADIHKAFECLWPKGTNIIELLPMPDKRVSRVLYAGLIDPRTILQNVISYSLYFDEILVMNPFMNPTYIKPEYNPVESPTQYKQETLKNALLFMQLMPFIEKGIINLIPDPCSLNLQLQKQIGEMAQSRLKGLKLSDDQMAPMKELCMDDMKRMMSGLPEASLRHNITKALPDLSEDDTEKVLEYMKQQRKADPLALLQPSIGKKGEGQMLISHLTPNFELGFFLAQLTGAILYTDNQFRWEEILKVSNNGKCLWASFSKKMSSFEFTFEANSLICLEMRKSGKLSDLRRVLHKIFLSVGSETDQTKTNQVITTLLSELDSAVNQAQKDWQWIDKQNNDSDQQRYRFSGKIRFNIPDQGFSVNTVNRLLLCYGRNNYLKSVPMAINVN